MESLDREASSRSTTELLPKNLSRGSENHELMPNNTSRRCGCAEPCQGFCAPAGAGGNSSWSYKGNGGGDYDRVESYQYVGRGIGDFEKVIRTTYSGYKLKKVWIAALVLVGIVGAVAVILGFSGGDVGSTSATAVASGSAAPPTTGLPSTMEGVSSTTEGLPPPPGQCELNVDGSVSGSPEEAALCCKQYNRGCNQNAGKGTSGTSCAAPCIYNNKSATCRERIDWLANHEYQPTDSDTCRKAYSRVMAECSDYCGTCLLEDAQCRPPSTTSPTPMPASQAVTAAPMAAGVTASKLKHATKLTSLDAPHAGTSLTAAEQPPQGPPETHIFDCKAGFVHWERGWSSGKQAWCCMHFGRACPRHGQGQAPLR